jgi:hypothetical protein
MLGVALACGLVMLYFYFTAYAGMWRGFVR